MFHMATLQLQHQPVALLQLQQELCGCMPAGGVCWLLQSGLPGGPPPAAASQAGWLLWQLDNLQVPALCCLCNFVWVMVMHSVRYSLTVARL